MTARMTGTVKWFNGAKGFGFINRRRALMSLSITPRSAVKARTWKKDSASSSTSSRAPRGSKQSTWPCAADRRAK